MQLVRFWLPNIARIAFGRLEGSEVVEVTSFYHPQQETGLKFPLSEVTLDCPLSEVPSKIIAVGLNYPAHIDEMKHTTVPESPVLFLKAPSSLIAPGQPIIAYEAWGQVDFEGELAVVIGWDCKAVTERDAMDYVLGFTIANDVTARTLQKQDTQWGRAKNFDTFCPLGPTLLTYDKQDPAAFTIETRVDGQVVQSGVTSQMRFSVPTLISFISHIMTLNPGDIILTGTPQGVGAMHDGQTISISISGIGTLENRFQTLKSPVLTTIQA